MAGSTRLVVGRIRGLHGLRGAVRVEVLTDQPERRFAPGERLTVEGGDRVLTVESAEPVADGPGWRLQFREVRSRTAAEALREAYLEVAVDRAEDLDPGAAYWHEVIGSVVRDSAGAELGRVAEVYRAGEAEVYVVRGGPHGEFDLPAVRDVITTFAPERGELVVDERVLDLGGVAVDAPAAATASGTSDGRPRRRHRWSRHGRGGQAQPSGSGTEGPGAPPPADPT